MATKTAKKTTAKETTAKEKTEINFAKGVFITETTFEDGNTVININFDARKHCEWMRDNVGPDGIVRTSVWRNKNTSRFSHNMSLNTFNPQEKGRTEITTFLGDDLPM